MNGRIVRLIALAAVAAALLYGWHGMGGGHSAVGFPSCTRNQLYPRYGAVPGGAIFDGSVLSSESASFTLHRRGRPCDLPLDGIRASLEPPGSQTVRTNDRPLQQGNAETLAPARWLYGLSLKGASTWIEMTGTVTVDLRWVNWCGHAPPRRLVLRFGSTGPAVAAAVGSPPRCVSASRPTSIVIDGIG